MRQRCAMPMLLAFILLAVLCAAGCSSDSAPQYVELDRSFNTPLGYAQFTPASGFSSRGVETGLQSNGKIIVMGSTVNGKDDDLLLIRYTRDGRIDTSFGTNGFVRYGDYDRDRGLGLAILKDDSIIVTGYSTIAGSRELLVVKFSANGVFIKDLLYSDLGTDIGFGITVTPDQKIVVIGESSSAQKSKQDLLLLRMDSNLQLDPTFGRYGAFHYDGPANESEKGFAVAAQPDGSLIACGAVVASVGAKEDMLVIRVTPDGKLDTGFGVNGSFIWASPSGGADYANNLVLQPDGRIIIAGAASTATGYQIITLRLLPSGRLDTGFGQGGVVSYAGLTGVDAYPYGVVVQQDGKIVIAGSSAGSFGKKDAVALRYNAGGQLDPVFGGTGVIAFEGQSGGDDVANGLALQPDQALVVTGYSNNGQYDAVLTWRLQ